MPLFGIFETSNSLAGKFAPEPATMTTAALAVPRCRCTRALIDPDDDLCCRCGREIRPLGTLGRQFRRAIYDRELRWARGEGLNPASGFLGLSDELGTNPDVPLLHDVLEARLGSGRP